MAKESHPHGWICKLFKLFSFSSFFFIFYFDVFFGHVNAWVLLWDGFRWKRDTLGGVGTCLGLILDDICLKMSKDTFYLCFYVRGLKLVYVAWSYLYATQFLCTQVCSWGFTDVGSGLHTWGLVYVHGPWPTYVRRLTKALLCPFSLLFPLFYFYM